MRFSLLPLFADDAVRLRFQWGRIVALFDWMTPAVAWLSISLVSAIILLLVLGLYLRDAHELRPAWAAVLISLRAAALLGLLVIFLQPQWRTEREVVHNSRGGAHRHESEHGGDRRPVAHRVRGWKPVPAGRLCPGKDRFSPTAPRDARRRGVPFR